MSLDRIDERARKRIGGAAWDAIRPTIELVNEAIVAVSETARGELTTIYVKYTTEETGMQPYCVLWIRKSSEITAGFAVPEEFDVPDLGPPARNMKYAGLTGYLTLAVGDPVPSDLQRWAQAAYNHCIG